MVKRRVRKRQLEKAKRIIYQKVYRKNYFDIYNKLESAINKEFENISLDFSSFVPVDSISFNSTIMNIENLTPVVGKRG